MNIDKDTKFLDVLNLFDSIELSSGNIYKYIPYWICIKPDGNMEAYGLDSIPGELSSHIYDRFHNALSTEERELIEKSLTSDECYGNKE